MYVEQYKKKFGYPKIFIAFSYIKKTTSASVSEKDMKNEKNFIY